MNIENLPEKRCKAILTNKIWLPYTEEIYEVVSDKLTYKFEKGINNVEVVRNYSVINSQYIAVPITRYDLIPKNFRIIDRRVLQPVGVPKFRGKLRESQQEIYDKVNDNCIIAAKPGWGKTFTALAIAEKLGQKTLIVVHNLKLRTQWAEEIKKAFGISPGIIGSGKFDIEPPIVVGNVQSVTKHDLMYNFGTLILDEAHRVPATTFTNIVATSAARYKIGLSGTPTRKDGKHVILFDNVSREILTAKKENVLEPLILVLRTDIKLPGNYLMPWANRVNDLVNNPKYFNTVLALSAAQAARGHKVLVVSDRVEFLQNLANELPNSVCITGETENQKELEALVKEGEKDIIFGSIQLYKEGISINELSCLILATPINNKELIIQLVGRVIRKHDNKLRPEVVDIALAGPTGANQLNTRLSAYRQEQYEIKDITDVEI